MRIGITGDTHGQKEAIRQVITAVGPVDYWLHTGDHDRDSVLLTELTGVPALAVAGNCDGNAIGLPDEFRTWEGVSLWLTHGHRKQVKSGLRELMWWGQQYEVDVIVFGHSHQALCVEQEGRLYLNPGSPAYPRGDKPSAAVLSLQHGRAQGEIIYF